MLEEDLSRSLSSLEAAAGRLSSSSNSTNAILLAVESPLVAANVGREVWLRDPLTSKDAEGSTHAETAWTVHRLCFAKLNGKKNVAK